jgi:hypothetical protein
LGQKTLNFKDQKLEKIQAPTFTLQGTARAALLAFTIAADGLN